MDFVVIISLLWLIVLISGLAYWIPHYIPKEEQDITISFTVLGFTFITMTVRFISRIIDGEMTPIYFGLYLLAVGVLVTALSGVYYWFPKYFPKGIPDPITGENDSKYTNHVFVASVTMALVLINLYEQSYSESVYKTGEVLSTLVNFGGKRKKLKS